MVRPFCEHFTDSTNHWKNTRGCTGREILGESWMKLVLMPSNKTLSIECKAAINQLHSVMRKCFVHVTARKDIRQFPWHPRWLMFAKCTELKLIKHYFNGSFRSASSVNVTWKFAWSLRWWNHFIVSRATAQIFRSGDGYANDYWPTIWSIVTLSTFLHRYWQNWM